jgi:FixJ family two-component response regulator
MGLDKVSSSIVYIVDDDTAVRDSLNLFIQSRGMLARGFESAESFLANYSPEYPGCLILDVRMPGISGLNLQQQLVKRQITIPIIFMSGHAEIPDSAKAFRAGAVDFFVKPFDNMLMLERIEETIKKDILDRKQRLEQLTLQNRLDRLAAREREVLQLIIDNHSNKETAKILDISYRTIEAHRAQIMKKLEADTLPELIKMFIKNGSLQDI